VNALRIMSIDEAAHSLKSGGVVALPTETVYGLAANALDPAAVARIFAIKGRPSHHPLIVHIASAAHATGWADLGPDGGALAEAFWPGPLTLVLPRGPLALDAVTGGLETVALRVPAHPVALDVLRRFGGGLAAPSANRFGHISPTSAAHVAADLADEDIGLVDGGLCTIGIESTIVDLTTDRPAVLRLGAIPASAIAAVIGRDVAQSLAADQANGRARAPGQLASHYAPRAHLEIVAAEDLELRRSELVSLGRGPISVLGAELGDTPSAWARSLYAALREADSAGPHTILIAPPPSGPMHEAVADRLRRAAAPRT
jgi:L-threonylcarbamoyladenylate synthase